LGAACGESVGLYAKVGQTADKLCPW